MSVEGKTTDHDRQSARSRSAGPRRRTRAGYLWVGGYVVLLALVGIYPAGYALERGKR